MTGPPTYAVENLAERRESGYPVGWIIAGPLCVLTGSVEKLRRAVQMNGR